MRNVQHRARLGFTLVELLVVITIIGILIALLMPAVQTAREAARRTQCINNLKQLSLACINYEVAHGAFPPAIQFDSGQNPASSDQFRANWIILILPYMDQQNLQDSFNLNDYISRDSNRTARATMVSTLICPSDTGHEQFCSLDGGDWARGNYGANGSNGPLTTSGWDNERASGGRNSPAWIDRNRRGVMEFNASQTVAGIRDGTSNTLLIGELRVGLFPIDRRGTWAMGTAGASALFWHGFSGDANGPNAANDRSDDIEGCSSFHDANIDLLRKERMTCWVSCPSFQATARSSHMGGVHVSFCDGSVHFISDFVETSGEFGGCCRIWDRLISSSDGIPLDQTKLGIF